MSKPRLSADARAFRRGIKLLHRFWGTLPWKKEDADLSSTAFTLRTTKRALQGYVSGAHTLARNPGVVERLGVKLITAAYAEQVDRKLSRQLHAGARELLGDRYARLHHENYRQVMWERAKGFVDHGSRYQAGTHLANFLAEDGAPILIAINEQRELDALLPVHIVDGCSNTAQLPRSGWSVLTSGVTYAPWRLPLGPWALSFLAIAPDSRLVARIDVEDVRDAEAVTTASQLAFAALEIGFPNEPKSYRDSEGYEDDDDDLEDGDEWKIGAPS